ncbi:MAG TPA: TonB-dependent receptor [Pyrinomonadaceae bacterium]
MRQRCGSFFSLISCALVMLCLATTVAAQFRAGVQGTVTDQSGGIIVGATLTLTNKETNKVQTATTSDDGFYRFTNLPPGRYTLTVDQSGFNKKTLENLVVNAEQVEGVNITLEPAGVQTVVTVTDTLVPALETENANINKAITTEEIRALPQAGRDPYELLRLTPGVFGDAARGGGGGAVGLPNQTGPGGSNRQIFQTENQPQISANGQRISSNNFQIDGVSVNSLGFGGATVVTPNQESVKEVRVLANNYSAEFGRNSGAQVLTVSQNGTNHFHGSLFLKNNSPGLNAFNKYGGPAAAPVRNNQHYNQFGGSIGGPLPIPRFGEGAPPAFELGRNKAFFFFSYEGLRNNTTDTATNIVETAQYRQLVRQLRPNSVTARILSAPGIEPRITSVIPVNCAFLGFNASNCREVTGGLDIGSPAGATGQYLSFGNLQGGGFDGIPDVQYVQLAVPHRARGNQFNPRFDFNLTQRDTLTFSSYLTSFTGQESDAAGRSRPMGDISTKPRNSYAMITYTRTLTNTMINEVRFNATRFAFDEVASSTQTNFGIPRIEIETLPGDRIRFGPPWAETTPGIFADNTFEFRDTLRWVRGTHGLSFGGELRREQDNNNLSGGSRPLYTFAGLFNFANDAPLFYQINADPRTGGPAASQRYFRSNTIGLFAQDDWKFRPNVTLNFGLRYEYFQPPTEKEGRLSNIAFGSQGLVNSRINVVDRLYAPDRNNFAPRLAFAWSPAGLAGIETKDKLVLRGGFGIAYNRIPMVLFSNTRGNPPFFARYQICCGTSASDFSTPFAGGQILYATGASNSPFSYPVNPALATGIDPATGSVRGRSVEVYGALPKEPNAYVYTYSLEGQYSLPYRLTAELGYQGSSSHKLIRLVNQNFLFPNNPSFFAVYLPTPDVNANYNAMLARLTRRFSRGTSFDAIYRWSKSIDTLSNEGPGAVTNQTFPQNQRFERGPSDYDVRHHFILSGLWELPFFNQHKDSAAGKLLGGWQLSGILTAHTGFPWTPLIGRCISTPGGQSICPARPVGYFGGALQDTSNEAFMRPNGNFPGGPARYFPLTDPSTLPLNTPPGIGRNSFRGPRYFDIDMSVAKRFGLPGFLGESSNFELKANFFNVFNILNLQPFSFNGFGTTIDPGNPNDPNFGRSPGGQSGRVVELQGRIIF